MSTPTERVTRVPLRGGAEIPQLGFGVFQVPLLQTAEVVREALAAGYRHIDTAAAYQNEQGVGEAVRSFGLEREQLFVTTKCWNTQQGYERAKRAPGRSPERLGFHSADLYPLHRPAPSQDLYPEARPSL